MNKYFGHWLICVVGLLLTLSAGNAVAQPGVSPDQMRAQVYVHDSPAAADLVAAARHRLRDGQWLEAARMAQEAVEESGDRLIETEPEGRYIEVRRAVARMIATQPDLADAYRQLFGPAARQALDAAGSNADALRTVMSRYPATEAAAAAALRLAARQLVQADFNGAAVTLESVRDLPLEAEQEVRWMTLRAAVALYRNRPDRLADLRGQLAEAGRDGPVQQLDALAESLRRPLPAEVFSPLRPLPPATLPEAVRHPIWSIPLETSLASIVVEMQTKGARSDAASQLDYLTTVPVVRGAEVYLNDGGSVYALDRASGRLIWRHTAMEEVRVPKIGGNVARFHLLARHWHFDGSSQHVVTPVAGKVVAVMGYSFNSPIQRWQQPLMESQVVCLDASTGDVLWRVKPAEVDPDLAKGFWFGKPQVSGGRAYVQIRRGQRTGFRDSYVAALDMTDGSPLWSRHVSSAAPPARQPIPGLAHLVVDGGWLYVDSRLGAIARINAADGSVDWLTTVAVSPPKQEDVGSPWEMSNMVLSEAGLIALDVNAGEVRVVDPASGRIEREIAAEAWHRPRCLLPVGDDVIAIGEAAARFDGRTLEREWGRTLGAALHGQPCVAGRKLFVPSEADLTVIDIDDGKVLDRWDVGMPANILVVDGQVVVARRDEVSSFSSWKVASQELRRQIKARPDDPGPRIALVRVAFSSGHVDVFRDTLDSLIDLLGRREDAAEAREALFQELWSMVGEDGVDDGLRRELYEKMALVARGAAQEAAYRLVYGRYLEEGGKPAEAIEQYQAVLIAPELREQLFRRPDGARQASLEARRGLQRIFKAHGRDGYRPYNVAARQRLDSLKHDPRPEGLIELVQAYPMADIAASALVEAGRRMSDQGRVGEAISWLWRAQGVARSDEQLAEVVGAQVEMLVVADRVAEARGLLERFAARHPEIKPRRDDEPISPTAWLSRIADLPGADIRRPEFDPPITGRPRVVPGEMVDPEIQSSANRVTDRLLTRRDDRIEMRQTTDMRVLWWRPIEGSLGRYLAQNDRQLWIVNGRGEIEMLDADTGRTSWKLDPAAKLREHLAQNVVPQGDRNADALRALVGGGAVIRARMRRQQDGSAPLIDLAAPVLAYAARDGRMIVADSETGVVRWSAVAEIAQATHLTVTPGHVVIAGMDEHNAPLLCVYDVHTGQLQQRIPEPQRNHVQWIGATPEGLLIYVTTKQVVAYDLATGQPRWIRKPGVQLEGPEAWMAGGRLFVRSRGGDLLMVDLGEDQTVRPVVTGKGEPPLDIYEADARFVIVTPRSVIAVDAQGESLWRDSISDPTQFVACTLSQSHVILLNRLNPVENQPQRRSYRVYFLDLKSGVIRFDREIIGPPKIDRAAVLDRRLVVGSDSFTAVLSDAN